VKELSAKGDMPQELGGKSANIILPSANLDKAIEEGVRLRE
jgi:acyl-CoA reductase-like NAD-dependent aldehyde dehydrogenase